MSLAQTKDNQRSIPYYVRIRYWYVHCHPMRIIRKQGIAIGSAPSLACNESCQRLDNFQVQLNFIATCLHCCACFVLRQPKTRNCNITGSHVPVVDHCANNRGILEYLQIPSTRLYLIPGQEQASSETRRNEEMCVDHYGTTVPVPGARFYCGRKDYLPVSLR